jgi:hypothetical protein
MSGDGGVGIAEPSALSARDPEQRSVIFGHIGSGRGKYAKYLPTFTP